jgi:hypothetical protein
LKVHLPISMCTDRRPMTSAVWRTLNQGCAGQTVCVIAPKLRIGGKMPVIRATDCEYAAAWGKAYAACLSSAILRATRFRRPK